MVLDRAAASERPELIGEAGAGVTQYQARPGVVDRRPDLRPVADDARIRQQPRHIVVPERGDRLDIEPGERGAIPLALAQDRRPRQPGLGAFKRQHLEQVALVA